MVKHVLGSTLKFAQTGKFHRKLSSVENPPWPQWGLSRIVFMPWQKSCDLADDFLSFLVVFILYFST